MNWLNKLEWKYRKFGIDNLMLYITATTLAVYLAQVFTGGAIVSTIFFNRDLILQGQVWRIVTFLFAPPTNSPLWLVIILYCYYWIGNSLEHTWGSFRFTVYYFSGALFAIISGFITGYSTNSYLNLSMFLALAQLFPNTEFRLFLILPIKAKWLAMVNWLIFGITFITALFQFDWATMLVVVFAVLNFLLFFGRDLWTDFSNYRKYGKGHRNFRDQQRRDHNNPWGF